MMIARDLATRLPRLHEAQERQEALNVCAAGLGDTLGVATRDWGEGWWSVRCSELPRHGPGNQLTGLSASALEGLDAAIAWFDEARCSMRIRLAAADLDLDLGRRLARLGFASDEVEAWMAAPIDILDIDAPAHDIRPVTSARDAGHFGEAFVAGWGIEAPIARQCVLAAMAGWPAPADWHRYVAWIDGQPAGEALLVTFGDVAYLAEAATVPAFRRRGVQRALIARRIADAREMGATTIFGGVQYGDASWANMRAMGLREATLTVTYRRSAASE